MKKVTLEQIKDAITKNILEDRKNEEVYRVCKDILSKHHEKPLGKKAIKEINAFYPTAYFINPYSTAINLLIPENNNQSIYLKSWSEKAFNFNDLDRSNTCYIEEKHNRISKNMELLNNTDKLHQIKVSLCYLVELHDFFEIELDSYDNPSRYDILNLIGIEIKERRND